MHATLAVLRPAGNRALATASKQTGPLALRDHIFFAKATADGTGRQGHVYANHDSIPLDLDMAVPKSMGGKGEGHNPEKLFAAGYSACFLGALQVAAGRYGKAAQAEAAKVNAKVFLGHPDRPASDPSGLGEGLGIKVELEIEGMNDDRVIRAAHDLCPYSRMMRHGGDVLIKKA